MKSDALVFQEVLYVSLCFDVLRRAVEHTLEDMSCALRFDMGLQVMYLYVLLFGFKAALGVCRCASLVALLVQLVDKLAYSGNCMLAFQNEGCFKTKSNNKT